MYDTSLTNWRHSFVSLSPTFRKEEKSADSTRSRIPVDFHRRKQIEKKKKKKEGRKKECKKARRTYGTSPCTTRWEKKESCHYLWWLASVMNILLQGRVETRARRTPLAVALRRATCARHSWTAPLVAGTPKRGTIVSLILVYAAA